MIYLVYETCRDRDMVVGCFLDRVKANIAATANAAFHSSENYKERIAKDGTLSFTWSGPNVTGCYVEARQEGMFYN